MIRYRLILIISVGLLLPAFTAANELANADLEQTDADRLAAWAPYGRGYMLETGRSTPAGMRSGARRRAIRTGWASPRSSATNGRTSGRLSSEDGARPRTSAAGATTACSWTSSTKTERRGGARPPIGLAVPTTGNTRQRSTGPRSRSARSGPTCSSGVRRARPGSTTSSCIAAASTPPKSA